MSDLNTAAQMISESASRRSRELVALSRAMGLETSKLDPSADWNNLAVAAYLEDRPYCLYFEPAFTEYHRHLEKTYGNDPALLAHDLSSSGHDVWKAIATVERIAEEFEGQELDKSDPYDAVTQYLNPWYLRLVEQAFDTLLGLPVYRLLDDEGKQPPSKPRQIHEAIKKQGWYAAGEFYRPIVRNGIAHEVEFLAETASTPVSIVYTDAAGQSETLLYSDLVGEVAGMIDECLAYAFAVRLILLEHLADPHVQGILRAAPSNLELRKARFPGFASSRSLAVQSVHAEVVNHKTQVRIECVDRTRVAEERLAELAALLTTANSWFGDTDTFFIGLRSKDPISFARVDRATVARWVAGAIDDRVFVESFDPVLMWPKRNRLGRVRANLARTIPIAFEAGTEEFRRAAEALPSRLPRAVRVLSLDDISHGAARRYRGDFVLDAVDQAQAQELLEPLLTWVRRQRIYHSPQSRKHWRRTPPHYVAGFVYSREKRERDRGAIPSSPFYIGRFEWRDPGADPAALPVPMTGGVNISENLSYAAAPDWPPQDRFVPR